MIPTLVFVGPPLVGRHMAECMHVVKVSTRNPQSLFTFLTIADI